MNFITNYVFCMTVVKQLKITDKTSIKQGQKIKITERNTEQRNKTSPYETKEEMKNTQMIFKKRNNNGAPICIRLSGN